MQCVELGEGNAGSKTEAGMRQRTPLHYVRKRRDGWPFKYYQANGRMYQNTCSRIVQKPDVGEALW